MTRNAHIHSGKHSELPADAQNALQHLELAIDAYTRRGITAGVIRVYPRQFNSLAAQVNKGKTVGGLHGTKTEDSRTGKLKVKTLSYRGFDLEVYQP